MTFTSTRLLSCFASSVLKKHVRKFSHVFPTLKSSPLAGNIYKRYFCEKSADFYADIEDDDFASHEEMSSYQNVDFETIAQGDAEKIKMLKRIQLEIDIMAQEGGNIPKQITSTNWIELMSFPSKYRRLKHIHFLYVNEQKKLIKKRKQEVLREELGDLKMIKANRLLLNSKTPVEYGLLKTTLFHRLYDTDIKKLYNFRLLQASMFGPHLIIDCGFEDYMNQAELSACAADMLKCWSINRDHFYPYDIIFCNMHKTSNLYSRLSGIFPPLKNDPAFPFNITDKHYLDLFPKEQLVYLTPHCNEEMGSFDGNSIYIIGGLWDKSKDFALTLAKAKKEGIRRAKFPLDKYIKWTYGKKTLTISECVAIMNDLKDGKSWDFAFRHIKQRQIQLFRRDLFDDGEVKVTNPKTGEHMEELTRQQIAYNVLLSKKLVSK